MKRHFSNVSVSRFATFHFLFSILLLTLPAHAQRDTELTARDRVFRDLGAGVTAIERGPDGRYYVLVARAPTVAVFDAEGQRAGQIPAAPARENSLIHGDALAIDTEGRLYVAERATNSVKVYDPAGNFVRSIPAAAPIAVTVPAAGEVAVVTSSHPDSLIAVLDTQGKFLRGIGQPAAAAERTDLNRYLNIGRLTRDAAGNIYFGFTYLPEPTVRRYDRFGYGTLEIELRTLEFQPAAQAARREITRLERGGTPQLKATLGTFAVDPESGDVWLAIGNLLLRYDAEGRRRASYRLYTPENVRLEPSVILVEPARLLIASATLGIFDFPHPDKATPR